MSFAAFGLSEPILRALQEQSYKSPTPIQTDAIPVVFSGRDLLASAQTGTGKTASFVLPILQRLTTQPKAKSNQASVLILAPTRELAAQIHESIEQYGKYLNVRSAAVFGGVKVNPQMMKLRSGVEILVATPGRLLDLYKQRAIRFDNLTTLVLDEADRMLDMGFINDIKKIMALLPKIRQTLLFSATFSSEICQLTKAFLNKPVEVSVTPRNATAPTVKQWVHPVDKGRKPALLSLLIRKHDWAQGLVFTRTKHGANKLVLTLAEYGIESAAIHGNKSQSQRTKALADFKQGRLHILVATDIAARGIDIDNLPVVINYDLPQVAEDYVHRIGRAGRAGVDGSAVSLVSFDELSQLQSIERVIKSKLEKIIVDDFAPTHTAQTLPAKNKPVKAQVKSYSAQANRQNRFGKSQNPGRKSIKKPA